MHFHRQHCCFEAIRRCKHASNYKCMIRHDSLQALTESGVRESAFGNAFVLCLTSFFLPILEAVGSSTSLLCLGTDIWYSIPFQGLSPCQSNNYVLVFIYTKHCSAIDASRLHIFGYFCRHVHFPSSDLAVGSTPTCLI